METMFWISLAAMDICIVRTLKKAIVVNAFGVLLDIDNENHDCVCQRKKRFSPSRLIYISKGKFSAYGMGTSCAPLGFENETVWMLLRYLRCAFHHFENPQTFADECLRVLKVNGKVFIAEPFFSPLVRCLANTLVFPFSKKIR